MTAFFNHLLSTTDPEPNCEAGAVDRFHDAALDCFLQSAADLHALDPLHWTAAELAGLVVRHLTPEAVPYAT